MESPDSIDFAAHQRSVLVGRAWSELLGCAEKIQKKHRLTSTEMAWVISQTLTGHLGVMRDAEHESTK
jgi:hypothetical protein